MTMTVVATPQKACCGKIAVITDTRGLTTVEYVIVLVLIAVTGIAVWSNFSQTLRGKVKAANEQVQGM